MAQAVSELGEVALEVGEIEQRCAEAIFSDPISVSNALARQ
ncbi:hypothetical protein WH7805_10833 [Synechococcus sp. WH 7805]|nr:hypothetical protein WH7805_10833 [Synechococcus sp. WH 7805]